MTDESYIQLTLEIAKKGRGNVSPNPLVGCIIIKNDRIIGAGYHEKYGENHAEINALNSATENVEGSTLYVNLEPCSHHGKTPPCVNKIIENKIKRVVIGTLDMNPLVSGKGIRKLKAAGIDVKVGVLEHDCIQLNKFFFKFITKKIPYVTLKAAQTLDGKIADKSGGSKWITSVSSRRYVHRLRARYDAVLIGKNTAKVDNPVLTVRLTEGRNPKRIVIDRKLNLSPNLKLFTANSDSNLIIITSKKSSVKKNKIAKLQSIGVTIIFLKELNSGKLNLKSALKELGKLNISSILVEGGGKVFNSFIRENLYDDIKLFVAPKMLGNGMTVVNDLGISSIKKSLKLKVENLEKVGDDILIELIK